MLLQNKTLRTTFVTQRFRCSDRHTLRGCLVSIWLKSNYIYFFTWWYCVDTCGIRIFAYVPISSVPQKCQNWSDWLTVTRCPQFTIFRPSNLVQFSSLPPLQSFDTVPIKEVRCSTVEDLYGSHLWPGGQSIYNLDKAFAICALVCGARFVFVFVFVFV